MRARSVAPTLSGVVTEWPAHQRPSDATPTESAHRYTTTKSARHAAGRSTTSGQTACAPSATSATEPRASAASATRFSRKSAPINRLGNSGKPSASTRRSVRRTPAFVGNMAYPQAGGRGTKPVMEIMSGLSRKCQTPSQAEESAKRAAFMVEPRSKEEFAACLATAVAGALMWVGVPAIMSALHIGGVW